MTFTRVRPILPLLLLAGVAMPVQADLTGGVDAAPDCTSFDCLTALEAPVVFVTDETTAATLALYEQCPAAIQQALDDGTFHREGSALIEGCGDAAMMFFMVSSDNAVLLTNHEGLAEANDGRNACLRLLYENLLSELPGADSIGAVLGAIRSVVQVNSSCDILSPVWYLIKDDGSETSIYLMGRTF